MDNPLLSRSHTKTLTITCKIISGTYITGGHMSSNGYVTSGYDYKSVAGIYCDADLPALSYQDALQLKDIISHYTTRTECRGELERDVYGHEYEYWTSGCANEINDLLLPKYGINVVGQNGSQGSCTIDLIKQLNEQIEELDKPYKVVRDKLQSVSDGWDNYRLKQTEDIRCKENEIVRMQHELSELYAKAKDTLSDKERYAYYAQSLYKVFSGGFDDVIDLNSPLVSFSGSEQIRPPLYLQEDLYQTAQPLSLTSRKSCQQPYTDYTRVYALDVAFAANDINLLHELMSKGAYQCAVIPLYWSEDETTDILILKKIASLTGYNAQSPNDRTPPYPLTQEEVVAALGAIVELRLEGLCDWEVTSCDICLMGVTFSAEELRKVRIILAQIKYDWGRYERYYPARCSHRLSRNDLAWHYNKAFPKTAKHDPLLLRR